jgi:hypothetical protein
LAVNLHQIGSVSITQIQPSGIIIDTSTGYLYDPSRRVEVPRLRLTPHGVEGETAQGERLLDVHHAHHPETHNNGHNSISIGFISHYREMRDQFGDHMQDGVGGENIIIDSDEQLWLADLGRQIVFQDQSSGRKVYLDVIKFAAPCEEFSHFAASSQHEKLPAEKLKATLQFLGNGRRGFLLALSEGQESAVIKPGDLVFTVVD